MCYSRQYFAPDNLPHATSSVAIVAVGTHEDILLNAICSAPAYFHKNKHAHMETHTPTFLFKRRDGKGFQGTQPNNWQEQGAGSGKGHISIGFHAVYSSFTLLRLFFCMFPLRLA